MLLCVIDGGYFACLPAFVCGYKIYINWNACNTCNSFCHSTEVSAAYAVLLKNNCS